MTLNKRLKFTNKLNKLSYIGEYNKSDYSDMPMVGDNAIESEDQLELIFNMDLNDVENELSKIGEVEDYNLYYNYNEFDNDYTLFVIVDFSDNFYLEFSYTVDAKENDVNDNDDIDSEDY